MSFFSMCFPDVFHPVIQKRRPFDPILGLTESLEKNMLPSENESEDVLNPQ